MLRVPLAFSPPPLNPCDTTNAEEATRARAFANWLASAEYLDGHPNLQVFNFFDLLASPDDSSPEANMLRPEYRRDGDCDSHPNQLANETIAPIFTQFVDDAVNVYRATVQQVYLPVVQGP